MYAFGVDHSSSSTNLITSLMNEREREREREKEQRIERERQREIYLTGGNNQESLVDVKLKRDRNR